MGSPEMTSGKLFDVRLYPCIFQGLTIRTHSRDDEVVLPILLWNYDVSITVVAPSWLK